MDVHDRGSRAGPLPPKRSRTIDIQSRLVYDMRLKYAGYAESFIADSVNLWFGEV